jgi:hypothetical protein
MTSMRMEVSGQAVAVIAAPVASERRLMTRAEIEDAVAAGVISAAVLDTLAKQPKARAHLDVRADAGATGRRRNSGGDPFPVADTCVSHSVHRIDGGAAVT